MVLRGQSDIRRRLVRLHVDRYGQRFAILLQEAKSRGHMLSGLDVKNKKYSTTQALVNFEMDVMPDDPAVCHRLVTCVRYD